MKATSALLVLLAGLLLTLGFSPARARAQDKPNLLFLLTDQHRRDGVGAYDLTPVKTPHLDRIAAEGVRFNRAYTAQPVCAPNRGAIMSGLYPHNHGVLENTWPLDTGVRILPDFYREQGYRTGYFGKWHLGDPARDAWDEMPLYPGDGRGSKHYYEVNGEMVYQTEAITPDVIDFMTRDASQPFVAFASYYPPHPAYSVPKAYEEMYADVYPDDERRRIYYGMVSAVDDAVGRLLKALDDSGMAGNTLVVFTTEHGHYFEHRWNDHDKRLCYDTSARIPMLMRFPGFPSTWRRVNCSDFSAPTVQARPRPSICSPGWPVLIPGPCPSAALTASKDPGGPSLSSAWSRMKAISTPNSPDLTICVSARLSMDWVNRNAGPGPDSSWKTLL